MSDGSDYYLFKKIKFVPLTFIIIIYMLLLMDSEQGEMNMTGTEV